ncbi:MAG: GNAT family N-acetyltransferase [Nocardioidaceae bacterium]
MSAPSGGPAVVVRPARDHDWPAIWPVIAATVRAGDTYALDPALSEAEARAWWLTTPPEATVVAMSAGALLGTARMGPNRPGPGSHVGTAAFMVAPEARGRGVGRRLAEHVVAWHREQGYRAIQFNAVVATNTTAVRLWRDLGFRVVGTVPEAFRHPTQGFVDLLVMHLRLDPSSASTYSAARDPGAG